MVWIYVDTNHYVGHPDHLKVFATPEAADEWFKENDPEGVVFGYEAHRQRTYARAEYHRSGAGIASTYHRRKRAPNRGLLHHLPGGEVGVTGEIVVVGRSVPTALLAGPALGSLAGDTP
jgi:hypothetical protein